MTDTEPRADLAQAPAPDWINNCAVCGRIVDTREKAEGGDGHGCEYSNGWACSNDCAEKLNPDPDWMLEGLAAIARHLAPGDDLVAQAEAALAKLQSQVGDDVQEAYLPEALHKMSVDTITALLARLSALTAQVERQAAGYREDLNAIADVSVERLRRAKAAEAEAATLRDRLARMEGALQDIAKQKKTMELETEYDAECADFEGGYDTIIDIARAALTDGGSNG